MRILQISWVWLDERIIVFRWMHIICNMICSNMCLRALLWRFIDGYDSLVVVANIHVCVCAPHMREKRVRNRWERERSEEGAESREEREPGPKHHLAQNVRGRGQCCLRPFFNLRNQTDCPRPCPVYICWPPLVWLAVCWLPESNSFDYTFIENPVRNYFLMKKAACAFLLRRLQRLTPARMRTLNPPLGLLLPSLLLHFWRLWRNANVYSQMSSFVCRSYQHESLFPGSGASAKSPRKNHLFLFSTKTELFSWFFVLEERVSIKGENFLRQFLIEQNF